MRLVVLWNQSINQNYRKIAILFNNNKVKKCQKDIPCMCKKNRSDDKHAANVYIGVIVWAACTVVNCETS